MTTYTCFYFPNHPSISTLGLKVLLLLLPAFLFAQSSKPPRHVRLPAALREASGMAHLPKGDIWLLNDSHNTPDVFRYDPMAGQVAEVRRLPVANRDWEDMAADSAGYLYIGDFGSNGNARRDLRIYRYHPATGSLDSILFHYPDQQAFPPANRQDWNFNCEAMVYFHDSLHLFSKNVFSGNFYTKHYVLPAKPGQYIAELRDSLLVKNRVITGAALSTDGRTLALTGYIIGKRWGFLPRTAASVMFFTDYPGSHFLQAKKIARRRLPKCLLARQFESVTQWSDGWWLAANEGKAWWRQGIWRVKGI